jgi:hypothetical protein
MGLGSGWLPGLARVARHPGGAGAPAPQRSVPKTQRTRVNIQVVPAPGPVLDRAPAAPDNARPSRGAPCDARYTFVI